MPPQGQRFDLGLRPAAQRRLAEMPAGSHSNRCQRSRSDANRTGNFPKDRLNEPTEYPTGQHEQERKQARLLRARKALTPALNLQVLEHVSFCLIFQNRWS